MLILNSTPFGVGVWVVAGRGSQSDFVLAQDRNITLRVLVVWIPSVAFCCQLDVVVVILEIANRCVAISCTHTFMSRTRIIHSLTNTHMELEISDSRHPFRYIYVYIYMYTYIFIQFNTIKHHWSFTRRITKDFLQSLSSSVSSLSLNSPGLLLLYFLHVFHPLLLLLLLLLLLDGFHYTVDIIYHHPHWVDFPTTEF